MNWRFAAIWRFVFVSMLLTFPFAASSAGPANVSVIQLISSPERFNGKLVRVRGFVVVESGQSALFISRDDAELEILSNSIWLGNTLEDVEGAASGKKLGKWILVEGVFDGNDRGAGDQYSGAIQNVSRVESLTRATVQAYE